MATTNPPPSPPTPLLQCLIPDCPLNEVSIPHATGIYRHNGQPQTHKAISIVFRDSNPPDFIWDASDARSEAMTRVKRGEDVEENLRIAQQNADLVGRFMDLHGGGEY